MRAIFTKYIGPTNTRGSRIKAWDGDNSVTISYPHELNNDGAHWTAAVKLCVKMGWEPKLIQAWHGNLGVFVFDPHTTCELTREQYREAV